MPPKRACDICISRKVKCNGNWPCDTCRGAVRKLQCTYLRPARRRGPKSRRKSQEDAEAPVPRADDSQSVQLEPLTTTGNGSFESNEASSTLRIPKAILQSVIRLYQRYSYSVWPVIDAEALISHIKDIDPEAVHHDDQNTSCLITALCAATMAQLQVGPRVTGSCTVDSTEMVQTCLRMRTKCHEHGEHMDSRSILASFFLHVYHAKINQRNSAMMYIQEALSGARVLRLDEVTCPIQDEIITNMALVFPLLWVSERGYALHLGLSPSYNEPLSIASIESNDHADIEARGLLELAKLFVAFDRISVRRKSSTGITPLLDLTDTEDQLSSLCFRMEGHVSARTADYHITRQWMRTILWQEALSMGLLSSSTCDTVLTFVFPARVGRDLLASLRWFREADLLPLGRDQVLKCFEVANSLADTVLLNSSGTTSRLELGPQDFLHALYQKIDPFLDQDNTMKSILRAKTAEALITAPARMLSMEVGDLQISSAEYVSVPNGLLGTTIYEDPRRKDESLGSFDWLALPDQQQFCTTASRELH